MSHEIEPTRKFRHTIPKEHQHSLDTRIAWLWNQRSGTVQMVHQHSPDVLDQTAASMILQALFSRNLNAIALIFKRLEGSAVPDDVLEGDDELRF